VPRRGASRYGEEGTVVRGIVTTETTEKEKKKKNRDNHDPSDASSWALGLVLQDSYW
jgi:hypothetical protein